MDRRIVYLVNPISGTKKKDKIIELIENKTKEQNIPYEVIFTNAAGDYDFLKFKIEKENITDVVMAGGDGTVNNVVGSLRDIKVNFGIIPLGSGNGLAYCAGIPRNSAKALELIFKGEARFIDAFTINNHFSCMLSGLGFDAQVAHDFATKASRGLFTYTQQSLVQYFKANPYLFEIKLNEFSFFTDAFLLCIANSNQFGNNFSIAPKAILNDGLLDIVIVQKMSKLRLPFAVLQQLRGNNELQELVDDMGKKNVLYFQTPKVTIRNLKHAPFHIDGEPKQTEEEFVIQVIPNCFRLIQPAEEIKVAS